MISWTVFLTPYSVLRTPSPFRTHLGPLLLLAALGLLFFCPLILHPTQVLYADKSDFLAYHLPHKRFLVRAWHETGELPQWCPYSFAGMPFVHDPQVGAFYPFHVPLYLLPETAVGAFLSWLLVLHVIAAGWCMYAYAVRWGLGRTGALAAAIGYMFAGKWLLHMLGGGHSNLMPLAWLPLVLLLLEEALRRGSLAWAAWSGAVFTFLILGTHSQLAFYGGVFVAVWSLRLVRACGVRRWLTFGATAALLAAALSAVQMLPTIEAAGLSSRARGITPEPLLDYAILSTLSLIGPYRTEVSWEHESGLGILWLASAAIAWHLCRPRARWPTLVGMGLVLFALVGGLFTDWLPGFRMFRAPIRMLLLVPFPLALLGGVTVEALGQPGTLTPERRRVCQLLVGVVFLVAMLLLRVGSTIYRLEVWWQPYWIGLCFTLPCALWILRRTTIPHVSVAWASLLLIDSVLLTWPLVRVCPEAEVFAPAACVQSLLDCAPRQARVLDLPGNSPLGKGTPLALLHNLEPVRGYNPLDVAAYKDFLQFLGDEDRPLRAFDGPLTYAVLEDFPIRNLALLNLLGVSHVLQPAERPPLSTRWLRVTTDEQPEAYDFIAGGRQPFPAYTLWENPDALPRAFVVPEAGPLPERPQVLSALQATDFRRRVLLEEWEPSAAFTPTPDATWNVAITTYQPNRIVVQVDGPAAGFLVLTDLWYPGWRCTIDGQPERLYRANFLFRATAVPAGRHEVIFTMEPRRYALGRTISLGGLAALVGITCFSILPTSPQRKQGQPALPRWQAGLVLTAVLLLIAYGIALAFSDADRTASAGPAMRGPEGADLELHRAVLRRVHAGESYYLTARAEMRHRDFPTRSPFNFRLPTLTWFLAQLPDPAWGQALLLGLAGVTLLLWLGVLTRDGVGLFGRAVGGLLLTGPLLLCRGEEGMVFPELWAGVGIALSLALHALGWWRAAVGCGLAALCVRELALPYVLVMLLAAAWEGRRREAVVWTLGLAGFAVYLFLHAARVWSLQEEIDRAGASWLGLGGWPFVLATARWNAYLADAPAWVAAVSVPLALLGLVTWHGPHGTRAALTVGAYVSLFLLLGRPDNHYWGLLYGPLLPLGLVGVPAAIQRLGARYRT